MQENISYLCFMTPIPLATTSAEPWLKETRRMPGYSVEVIDLGGLNLEEGFELGLQSPRSSVASRA